MENNNSIIHDDVVDCFRANINYHEKNLKELVDAKKKFTRNLIIIALSLLPYLLLVVVGYFIHWLFFIIAITLGWIISAIIYELIIRYVKYNDKINITKIKIQEAEVEASKLFLKKEERSYNG